MSAAILLGCREKLVRDFLFSKQSPSVALPRIKSGVTRQKDARFCFPPPFTVEVPAKRAEGGSKYVIQPENITL